MRTERKLIDSALILWTYSGLDPFYTNCYILVPIIGICFTIIYILLTIVMMILEPMNFDVFVNGIESLSSFLQGAKVLPALYFRNTLRTLITQIDRFWTVEKDANDFSFSFKAIKGYKACVLMTLCMIYLSALINREPMFRCYIPNIPGAVKFVMISQILLFFFDVFWVIGMDLLFNIFCIIIKEQLRILIIKMQQIENVGDDAKSILFKKWVDHHVFMKEYTAKFESVFTHMLLTQYLFSMYTICVEVLQITQSNDISIIAPACTYVISLIFQMSLFCFSAEEVTSMSIELSNIAYQIKWYNLPIHLQKNVQIITCCTMEPVYFKAVNMISINRHALTMIFKGALSFYTLIQNVQEK